MSEILRIGPAEAKNDTAQDAPRTTIGTRGDLQVYLISGSRVRPDLPGVFALLSFQSLGYTQSLL